MADVEVSAMEREVCQTDNEFAREDFVSGRIPRHECERVRRQRGGLGGLSVRRDGDLRPHVQSSHEVLGQRNLRRRPFREEDPNLRQDALIHSHG